MRDQPRMPRHNVYTVVSAMPKKVATTFAVTRSDACLISVRFIVARFYIKGRDNAKDNTRLAAYLNGRNVRTAKNMRMYPV